MRIEYEFISLFGNTVIKDRGWRKSKRGREGKDISRRRGVADIRNGCKGITGAEAPAGNPL